jgi:hypothetical protein
VREQDADLVLRIPESYAKSWSKGEPAQVELIYDASQRDAQGSIARLQGILDAYAQRSGNLARAGARTFALHPQNPWWWPPAINPPHNHAAA